MAAVLVLSVLIRVFDIDRAVSKPWYDAVHQKWPLERAEPLYSIYLYGVYPPLLLGLCGLIAACVGHRIWPKAEKKWLDSVRRGGLFLALTLAIGPGLLVNGCFKSFWGRPRPIQCQDFGGEFRFRPVGDWSNQFFLAPSFPSGHASVAFYLMAPGFFFHPSRSQRGWYWLLGGIGYGMAMGCTRIMQGGHFLSDVIWAGLIVYLVGAFLSERMLQFESKQTEQCSRPLASIAPQS